MNRVLTRSYSGESGYTTPTVTYTYDDKTFAKGKLTKVSSSVSATEYTAFDPLGRVTAHKQMTDGNDYATAYAYNLSGAMVEETYPSTRKVKNIIDGNGDLSMVQSKKNTAAGYWTYANNFTHNAAGAVTSMQLGNGYWEGTVFNSRLQPTQISLGTTQGSTGLLKLDYSYGTTQNNGNIQSQAITVPGLANPFVQTYAYDSLNRISSAEETNNSVQSWKQAFTYDRYGNRNFDESGLDYAEARYFDAGFGRFSSPDDVANDTRVTDPQSWNLYVYVRNNPLLYKDSNGKDLTISFKDGNTIKTLTYKVCKTGRGYESTLTEKGSAYDGQNKAVLDTKVIIDKLLTKDFQTQISSLIDDSRNHNLFVSSENLTGEAPVIGRFENGDTSTSLFINPSNSTQTEFAVASQIIEADLYSNIRPGLELQRYGRAGDVQYGESESPLVFDSPLGRDEFQLWEYIQNDAQVIAASMLGLPEIAPLPTLRKSDLYSNDPGAPRRSRIGNCDAELVIPYIRPDDDVEPPDMKKGTKKP
jgi:RHS repeat-associated protein